VNDLAVTATQQNTGRNTGAHLRLARADLAARFATLDVWRTLALLTEHRP
jgi:hypothetical protein